jgi:hypothetical protein
LKRPISVGFFVEKYDHLGFSEKFVDNHNILMTYFNEIF